MYCEYCNKPFGQKKNERKYKHINIRQPIATHIFCSRDCKTKWCFAVQNDELNPNKRTKYLQLNLKNKLSSELNDLNVLREYISVQEYEMRYKEIINKEEFKGLSLANITKRKKFLKI